MTEDEKTLRHYVAANREDIVKYAFMAELAASHFYVHDGKQWTKPCKSDAENMAKHFRDRVQYAAKDMVANCAALGELLTQFDGEKK